MGKDLLGDDSSDNDVGGADVSEGDLKVNAEFAKRFEYNKKREELQRLEEKIGKTSNKRKRDDAVPESASSEESSSSSDDEDEEAEFATEAIDSEIMDTLKAIRSKDPRVYDPSTTFYAEIQENEPQETLKKEKPMYLRDYHRQNLLNGIDTAEDEPLSYNQQQEQLKRSVIGEMHAAADSSDEDGSEPGDGFLVKKQKEKVRDIQPALNVENADRDPETFLSNFMAARAWIPNEHSEFQPFESDDEEDERRAEEFEEAYNMRFEDPQKSNETLRSHARDMAAKHSVRREEKNVRKKKREAERLKKEQDKQQLKEDKARLKKLRMDEVEEKVKRIKKAAGIKSSDLQPEDWARFIDDDWDDSKWEEEMHRRFDDQYYAEKELISEDEEGDEQRYRKPKKPKFDDDIDIKDIVPDFDEEQDRHFSLSDDEDVAPRKNHKQIKEDKKREAKRERRIIEQLVEDQLKLDLDNSLPKSGQTVQFRYRETSPNSFGMTSRDILMADDGQLNQFAGLKKLAAFRELEKKEKDKKKLGKKARLRQWRKETFGNEEGLQDAELVPLQSQQHASEDENGEEGGVDIRTSGKKKRRKKNKKQRTEEVVV